MLPELALMRACEKLLPVSKLVSAARKYSGETQYSKASAAAFGTAPRTLQIVGAVLDVRAQLLVDVCFDPRPVKKLSRDRTKNDNWRSPKILRSIGQLS